MASQIKGTTGTVLQLKESLGKEHGKIEKFSNDGTALSSSFYERILDIFHRLNDLPIDLKILTETLIGTMVSKFKSCQDEKVSTTAKTLIKKWKKMAKQGGLGSASKAAKQQQKDRPLRRQSSTSSAAASKTVAPDEEWNALPQLRKNVCVKLHSIVSVNNKDNVEASVLISKVTEIESAMDAFCKGNRVVYAEKFRSLVFNLKKNASLCSRVITTAEGGISGKALVKMTAEQLATSEKIKERQAVKQQIADSRRLDWEEANEDKINDQCGIKGELLNASLFTCGRCKSIKTTSTQKQTRSADEPMTVFVYCKSCGNRWKC